MTIEEEATAFARAFLIRATDEMRKSIADPNTKPGDETSGIPHTLLVQAGDKLVAGELGEMVYPSATRNGVLVAQRNAGKVRWAGVFFEAWMASRKLEDPTIPLADHPERVTSLVLLLELAGETEQRAFTAKLPDLEIEEMPASSEGRLFNFSGLLRPVAEG